MSKPYLHLVHNDDQIAAIRREALRVTGPQQLAFRKAVIWCEELRLQLEMEPVEFNRCLDVIAFDAQLKGFPIAGEDKMRLQQVSTEILGATTALYEALAEQVDRYGLVCTSDISVAGEQMRTASPEGYISGYQLIDSMMRSMQQRAMESARTHTTPRRRG
jgi:hypothetical protein